MQKLFGNKASTSTVSFGDLVWTVEYVNSNDPRLQDTSGSVMGITYFDGLSVCIRIDDISPNLLARVCRHEAVHMAVYSYGWDKTSLDEETIANFFECHGEEIVDNARVMALYAIRAYRHNAYRHNKQLFFEINLLSHTCA